MTKETWYKLHNSSIIIIMDVFLNKISCIDYRMHELILKPQGQC